MLEGAELTEACRQLHVSGHSPSSYDLDGDESGELQAGGVRHVSVDLVCLAAELGFFKQDDLEEHAVMRNTHSELR